jgi:phage terminase large subunit
VDEVEVRADFPIKLQPLFKPARYKVAYGGRGGAKSWGYARALLILAAQKKIRILCTREIQKSIKDSVHKLLSDQIEALGYGGLFTILQTEIRCSNGSEFLFAGLSDLTVESIKSFEGVDIVWVEEAHAVTKRSWSVLIPTIRKDGSEIWITFNPELDTDETYVRFVEQRPPGTVLMPINWPDNPWFSDILRQEKDHLQKIDPVEYENVWNGVPRAVVAGAIYYREISQMLADERVRNVPYDPRLKVHTVWDLGWNDAMTITFCQRLGGEMRIIDYIEDSHKTYAEYVAEINKRPWLWGHDWLPHDGEARNAQTGKSAKETLQALGRHPSIVPNLDIETGIKAVRMLFPRLYMDKTKCTPLLNRLKRYRRVIPTTTNEPGAPRHDENSHGADNVRYLAVIADRMSNDDRKPIAYKPMGIA